jgi:hypothetical protein
VFSVCAAGGSFYLLALLGTILAFFLTAIDTNVLDLFQNFITVALAYSWQAFFYGHKEQ